MHEQVAQHLSSSRPKGPTPIPRGNFGKTRGGVGKSGVLEHKNDNISDTRKDIKSYCGGPIGIHQRSVERYHPPPPTASPSPRLGVRNPNPKLQSLDLRNGESYELQILYAHSKDRSEQKHIKNYGKSSLGLLRDSQKIFGHPYIGRTPGHLCGRSSAYLY